MKECLAQPKSSQVRCMRYATIICTRCLVAFRLSLSSFFAMDLPTVWALVVRTRSLWPGPILLLSVTKLGSRRANITDRDQGHTASPYCRIQIEEAQKQVGRIRVVMMRIEDAVVRLLSVSGVMLVVWHTVPAPMASPFLISPLLLLLALITMRLLCPPGAEIRWAHVGSDPIKRTCRRLHHGQA
jgi:hypothetical protein